MLVLPQLVYNLFSYSTFRGELQLRGAGGYGKTTLALAICHDERVRSAFDDGIFWVTLGDKLSEADLQARIRDVLAQIMPDYVAFSTLEGAKYVLQEAVGDRYLLLVVDDVWHSHDLTPFIYLGKNAVTLVTTRNLGVLDGRGYHRQVDAMKPAEAVQLIGAGPQSFIPCNVALYSEDRIKT